MKILKGFFIGAFTTLLTLVLFVLGVSLNLKYTITDTVGVVVKKEITDNIVDTIAENSEMNKEEIRIEINKVLENNPTIKKTVEDCFDMAIDILNGKNITELNLRDEIEKVINDNESVLNEYGITITEEDKEEILNYVSSEEFSSEFNNSIKDIKQNMPSYALTIFNIFNIVISQTFKLILIISAIILIVLIALLKKSFYKWLPNFSVATIINGILYSTVFVLLDEILKKSEEVTISLSSFKLYGFIMIGLGILSIILNIILNIILKKLQRKQIVYKEEQEVKE